MRFIWFIVFIFLISSVLQGFGENTGESDVLEPRQTDPPFFNKDNHWADSVFNTLSLRERIGQLFMVAAYSNRDQVHVNSILQLVEEYKIGGLIFFQGGPVRQANLTNQYQAVSKVPLMIGIDGEWGLGMRLDSTISFPRQMALGAIEDENLIYQFGQEVARQCHRMGIQINFAPVVDVNSNPLNPVIHVRSFGQDPEQVASRGINYMLGMQDHHILATAKHFPGHGNVNTDSHFTMPVVNSDIKTLQEVDLLPFKKLIKAGVGGIMVAHLSVPAIDSRPNIPSSLSEVVISGLLINQLQFKGLIFTDALNMKGVTDYFKPGDAEVKAILAGNDVLLYPQDVVIAIDKIEKAVLTGQIPIDIINRSVYKILLVKQWMGLNKYTPVSIQNLVEDLSTPSADLLKRKVITQSISLLRNTNDIIPIQGLENKRIALVAFGVQSVNEFQIQAQMYTECDPYVFPMRFESQQLDSIYSVLSSYNTIIVSLHGLNNKPAEGFGLSPQVVQLIDTLSKSRLFILAHFGSPYVLKYFTSLPAIDAILLGYDDGPITRSYAAQIIFGGRTVKGKLPVTVESIEQNSGIEIEHQVRLAYAIPEEAGIDRQFLNKVDSIINDAIHQKAMPGCQILFAKEGKVIYHKAFGFQTYDSIQPVQITDLFDIASLTKVVATTAAIMKLYDENQFSLDVKLPEYMPELNHTNKKKLKVRELLLHQAGLKSWIPFYISTLKNGQPDTLYYKRFLTPGYSVKVADSLFIMTSYSDTILQTIYKSDVSKKKEYLYSDLGFFLLGKMVENRAHKPIEEYVSENFYLPLGAATLGYLPLNRFDASRIVPTQNDTVFRKQLLRGYVHDPGAALMGGVSGHAGLFSNANSLAKFCQMLLWEGSYGGTRFINSSTINLFTSAPNASKGNRRGLGFDKPEPDHTKISPVCEGASLKSYGHTGFTGTMMWIDPEYQSVFIFLSNRIYPDQENNRLVEMNIRTKVQQVFIDACNKAK